MSTSEFMMNHENLMPNIIQNVWQSVRGIYNSIKYLAWSEFEGWYYGKKAKFIGQYFN